MIIYYRDRKDREEDKYDQQLSGTNDANIE